MALATYLQLARNFYRMNRAIRRGENPIYWPLVTSFYLNHRCNLSCSYCDDGTGSKYPDVKTAEMDTDQVVRVLRLLRDVNRIISFTGGEPTLRRDFPDIVRAAQQLGFVTHVNTNATIPTTLFKALPFLDNISVSLDTLDEARSDKVFGVGPGRTRRVLETLDELVARQRRGARFDLIINTVIHQGNVPDVRAVLEWTLARGAGWAPLPYAAGPYPSPGLAGERGYIDLMNHLIDLKRSGENIMATVECLAGMRDFIKFDCVPMSVARIQPNGDLYFPCNILHTYGANLLEAGSFREAVDFGLARHGYQPPHCDNRCHMSCYMDFSMILADPTVALKDGLYRARGKLRRFFTRAAAPSPAPSAAPPPPATSRTRVAPAPAPAAAPPRP